MQTTRIFAIALLVMAMAAVTPGNAQAFRPFSDIEGDWGYKLGAAAADIDLTGKVASPIDDTYIAYVSPTVYDLLGQEIPMMEFVVLDSPEEGQGNVAGVGLGIIMPGQVKLGSDEFMLMSMMANNMKRDVLELYDESLVVTDTKTDEMFHFVMADSRGNMIEILVDADGLGYWHKTAELEAVLAAQRESEPDIKPASVKEEKYTFDRYDIVVESYREVDSLGGKSKQGAKYVIVTLTITNTGSDAKSPIMDFHYNLGDSKGRQFTSDSSVMGSLDNPISMAILQPDIPETGQIAYLVPEGATGFKLVESSM